MGRLTDRCAPKEGSRIKGVKIITREEAKEEILDYMKSDCYLDAPSNEACEIAVKALRPVSREQVEKVWRGEWEWYDEEIGSPLEGIERDWGWRCSKCKVVLPDDFDDPDNPPAMRFCQWCGAAMTDEAMQMVMERMDWMVYYENNPVTW